MRISCVGAGPAGLYFALLMKRGDPSHEIRVFERGAPGRTSGWGVVFWDDLLTRLKDSDPETARAVQASSFRWEDQVVHVRGERTIHLGGHGFSIGRDNLLAILTRRALELGVEIEYGRAIDAPSSLPESDLVVSADGIQSRMRRLHSDRFRTRVHAGRNKYVWLGTSKVFRSFTFPFVETKAGWVWFHGYGFDDGTSTCVVECAPETWSGLGFDTMGTNESLRALERIFERHLDGHPLKIRGNDDRLPWGRFSTVTNGRWHHGNVVLMGDSAHTTHFTIGSGTKLAMEDAIALAAKIEKHGHLRSALDAYARERQDALRVPQRAARCSSLWFENISRYIDLPDTPFGILFNHRVSRLLSHTSPHTYLRLHRLLSGG